MIKSYSASSLKLLQKSKKEYDEKYKLSLYFRHTNEYEKEGNKFHALICYYLKGFDVLKMTNNLDDNEKVMWQKFVESGILNKNYFGVELPFLVRVQSDIEYYLNGRFDAVLKENDAYTIYDWKSENIPKDPENDIQTIVYLYSASKLYNTENIKIKYVSIKKLETFEVDYNTNIDYEKIISEIVSHDN